MASRKDKMHNEVVEETTPRHAAATQVNDSPDNGANPMEKVLASLREIAATVGTHCQTLDKHEDRLKTLEERLGKDDSPLMVRLRKDYSDLTERVNVHDKDIQALAERVSKLEGANPAPAVPAAPAAPAASVAPINGTLNFRVSVPYSIGVVFGDANITRG